MTSLNIKHDDAMQRLAALLHKQDMAELERALLDLGLQYVCSVEFIDHCRIARQVPLVMMLATLGAGNRVNETSAQRLLELYQSRQHNSLKGSLAELSSDHVLNHCLRTVWAGKSLPLEPHAKAHTQNLQGSDADFELSIEFLIDHDQVDAALALLRSRWPIKGVDVRALRMVKLVLKRYEATQQTTQHARGWIPVLAFMHARLKTSAGHVALCENLALLLARASLLSMQFDAVDTWASAVRSRPLVLKAIYLRAMAACRSGDIMAAYQALDQWLISAGSVDPSWIEAEFHVPGSNVKSFDLRAARAALEDLHEVLGQIGKKPFLVSGTLLGYARVRDFLSHDKDIDVGVFGSEDPFEILNVLNQSDRFQISVNGAHLDRTYNLGVRHVSTGMALDIFLYHPEGDKLVTGVRADLGYLQRFAFTPFDLQAIEFVGVHTFAPSNIELNLQENFGEWRTSDPGYISHLESPSAVDSGGAVHMLVGRLKLMEALIKRNASKGARVCRVLRRHSHMPDAPALKLLEQLEARHGWGASVVAELVSA